MSRGDAQKLGVMLYSVGLAEVAFDQRGEGLGQPMRRGIGPRARRRRLPPQKIASRARDPDRHQPGVVVKRHVRSLAIAVLFARHRVDHRRQLALALDVVQAQVQRFARPVEMRIVRQEHQRPQNRTHRRETVLGAWWQEDQVVGTIPARPARDGQPPLPPRDPQEDRTLIAAHRLGAPASALDQAGDRLNGDGWQFRVDQWNPRHGWRRRIWLRHDR